MSRFVSRMFFFKQKTAEEMRISDGSADVCASDLEFCPRQRRSSFGSHDAGSGALRSDIVRKRQKMPFRRKRLDDRVQLGGEALAGLAHDPVGQRLQRTVRKA